MRHLALAYAAAGLAVSGFGVLALCLMRKPDIPHSALDRKYGDRRSAFFDGPCGVRIHYRDEGRIDGPPLFLVHGYCASLHTWEPWVEQLKSHYRIISLDLPGHGLTRTPSGYRVTKSGFAAVIDAAAAKFGLTRFALVGSSMGGAAAWDYASRRPERVSALVLVGAAGWAPRPDQDPMDPKLLDLMRSPIGPLVRDLDNSGFMRKSLRTCFSDPSRVNEAMVERHAELARAPMNRDVQMQLALKAEERPVATLEALTSIKAPTLVLHGDDDRVVPAADGRKFAEAIPKACLVRYRKVGHIVQEELADQSAADVHAFLVAALRRSSGLTQDVRTRKLAA